jgi:hypothetical protein
VIGEGSLRHTRRLYDVANAGTDKPALLNDTEPLGEDLLAIGWSRHGDVSVRIAPIKMLTEPRTIRRRVYRISAGYGRTASSYQLCCLLQGCHVDDEAIFDVVLLHPIVGGFDLLHGDGFDVCDDVTLCAEVEKPLGIGDASDEGAGEASAQANQGGDGG